MGSRTKQSGTERGTGLEKQVRKEGREANPMKESPQRRREEAAKAKKGEGRCKNEHRIRRSGENKRPTAAQMEAPKTGEGGRARATATKEHEPHKMTDKPNEESIQPTEDIASCAQTEA